MIVIFEDRDRFIDRNKIYDVVPVDALFINSYLISSSFVSDRVFHELNRNKEVIECDNRIYKM